MRHILVVLAAIAIVAVPTFAAVTLNPSTMTGFVGKGDVQLAFGWNNKQMQQNQDGVGFYYEASATYQQSCIKETQRHTIRHVYTKKAAIATEISRDARQKNQMVGYILTGADVQDDSGAPLNVCPGGFDVDLDGEFPVPTLVEGESVSGLYTTYGDSKVQLTWPVVVVLP